MAARPAASYAVCNTSTSSDSSSLQASSTQDSIKFNNTTVTVKTVLEKATSTNCNSKTLLTSSSSILVSPNLISTPNSGNNSSVTAIVSGVNPSTTLVKKRYTCEQCAYSTDRRDLYNRHENIHKEDKPFHCYVCHKLFNRADHVKKHFLRIHKGRPYNVALIRRRGITSVGNNNNNQLVVPSPAPVSTAASSLPAQMASTLSQANTHHSFLPSAVVATSSTNATSIGNSSNNSNSGYLTTDGTARSTANALITPLVTSLATSLAANGNANGAAAAAILAAASRKAATPPLAVSLANDTLGVLGSASTLTPLAALALAHQRATAATAQAATTILSSATSSAANSSLTATLTTLTALGRVGAAAAGAAQAAQVAQASIAQLLQPDGNVSSGSSASIPLVVPIGPITPAAGTVHDTSSLVCQSAKASQRTINDNCLKQEDDVNQPASDIETDSKAELKELGRDQKLIKDYNGRMSEDRGAGVDVTGSIRSSPPPPVLEAIVSSIGHQQQSRTLKRKADSSFSTSPSTAKSKVLVETSAASSGLLSPAAAHGSITKRATTALDLVNSQKATSPVVRGRDNSNKSKGYSMKTRETYNHGRPLEPSADKAQQSLHNYTGDVIHLQKGILANSNIADKLKSDTNHKTDGSSPELKEEHDDIIGDKDKSQGSKRKEKPQLEANFNESFSQRLVSTSSSGDNGYTDSTMAITSKPGTNMAAGDQSVFPLLTSTVPNSRRHNPRRSTRTSSTTASAAAITTPVSSVTYSVPQQLANHKQNALSIQLSSIRTRQRSAQQRSQTDHLQPDENKCTLEDANFTVTAAGRCAPSKTSHSSTTLSKNTENISRISSGVEVTVILPPPPKLTPKPIDEADECLASGIDNQPSNQKRTPHLRANERQLPDSSLTCDPVGTGSSITSTSTLTASGAIAGPSKKRETAVLEPSQVKEYTCDQCPWRGVDGWGLRRHMNTHLKPFRCQLCDYKAARSERLGAHVLRVHGKHLCAKCENLSFPDAAALDHHVRTAHRSTNQYTRPLPNGNSSDLARNASGGGSAFDGITSVENSNGRPIESKKSPPEAADTNPEVDIDDESGEGELLVDDRYEDDSNYRDSSQMREIDVSDITLKPSKNEVDPNSGAVADHDATLLFKKTLDNTPSEGINLASCWKTNLEQLSDPNEGESESEFISDFSNTKRDPSLKSQQLGFDYIKNRGHLEQVSHNQSEEKKLKEKKEDEEDMSSPADVLQLVDDRDVDEGVDTFFCPWCILSFADKLSLAYHLETRHPGAPIGTNTFISNSAENMTGELIETSRAKQHHHHVPAFPYQCTICGFKCFTQGTIMEHMRIHSGQLARCRAETESCEHSPSGHATSDSKKKISDLGSSTSKRSLRCGFVSPFDSELTRHVVNLHLGGLGGVYGSGCASLGADGVAGLESMTGSCLARARCAHCGLAVNRSEELMRHVKKEHHIAPLECTLCRKAFLEFFPEFYGRICPSTAPTADQYTHIPPHLLLCHSSAERHQPPKKLNKKTRQSNTDNYSCRKRSSDLDLQPEDNDIYTSDARNTSNRSGNDEHRYNNGEDDLEDDNEDNESEAKSRDTERFEVTERSDKSIGSEGRSNNDHDGNPRGFLSRLLTSVYRQLAEHRSLDATTASIILNTIHKLNDHNSKKNSCNDNNGSISISHRVSNCNRKGSSPSQEACNGNMDTYHGDTNTEIDIVSDSKDALLAQSNEIAIRSRKRATRRSEPRNVIRAKSLAKGLTYGSVSRMRPAIISPVVPFAAQTNKLWSNKLSTVEARLKLVSTADDRKKHKTQLMETASMETYRSDRNKNLRRGGSQGHWLPLLSLRRKTLRCPRCPNPNISLRTPGAKKVHVLVKHRIQTSVRRNLSCSNNPPTNPLATPTTVPSFSRSSANNNSQPESGVGTRRAKTRLKEENEKVSSTNDGTWKNSKPGTKTDQLKQQKQQQQQRYNKSRTTGSLRQTERPRSSGPSLRSRKK
ncbi:uncharacterized protein LOC111253906 isoform X2 [Varroa destructor]|uniref:C2H2-type domain-containing protein n=1 Tax=Varroa destructor TaxID=109461 RepID=A0A7M7MJ59_VARDE|nr:uncharacterized protein LOC111253906 isoform X2 [Varroa destructor]